MSWESWYINVALIGGFISFVYWTYKFYDYAEKEFETWKRDRKLREENKEAYR